MSVIVYADKQPSGAYNVVRGYHGLGGIEVVNWESLLEDIVPQLIVVVGPGPDLNTLYRRERAEEIVDTAIAKFGSLEILRNFYFGESRAVFDRCGNKIG